MRRRVNLIGPTSVSRWWGNLRWRAVQALRSLIHAGDALTSMVRRSDVAQGASPTRSIAYSHSRLSGMRDRLLLRDFDPIPMVKLTVSTPKRARFPVIDVHGHLNDGVVMKKRVDPSRFIEVMDAMNVQTIINLTGGWGERLENSIKELAGRYPGRFLVFWQIDYSRSDEPDYLLASLQRAHRAGARGVKVLKDLGLTARDSRGQLIPIDDPRLDVVWAEAARLQMPVGIHAADPDAFFQRVDRHNERYLELVSHPDWSFHGHGLPAKSELLEQLKRVIERHPKTQFWGLHVANHPENLDEVSDWMRSCPNLHVEIGGRVAELGRQPRRARRFFLEFQDRVMFGSDAPLTEKMYQANFRFLETADEYFEYPGYPNQGRWRISGIHLPDLVLRKVYYENALRMLNLDLPALKQSSEQRLTNAGDQN